MPQKILVLHGNRQTGQLLLGRMDKLRKRLRQQSVELVAPDAPWEHPEDPQRRTWWKRQQGIDNNKDVYIGLEESMAMLQSLWERDKDFVGLLGFSQGARLTHLLGLSHQRSRHARESETAFAGLRLVVMVAGYDAPLPPEFNRCYPTVDELDECVTIPSLHVWGTADKLIRPAQSLAVTSSYRCPQLHEHDGGHHVPMRAANVRAYVDFIRTVLNGTIELPHQSSPPTAHFAAIVEPVSLDEETAQMHIDEIEALAAIFPEEFQLLSRVLDDGNYAHPISYCIQLQASEEGIWPKHPLTLEFRYPYNYPQDALPDIKLIHDNNMMEFSTSQVEACLEAVAEAARKEQGMPSVMSCVYAARDFFESGSMETTRMHAFPSPENGSPGGLPLEDKDIHLSPLSVSLRPSSTERIHECNLQGLKIAESILQKTGPNVRPYESHSMGNGGVWKYMIGLVGKPSAGKSTFFNAATAFARQRDDSETVLGGATMAPHPFTTIDPNNGFCLLPAPQDSCPEEDYEGDLTFGSTHGRDNHGRRLIPMLLRDVAGLVPNAYQGRGRGNKFLHDLTGADVLVHVLDASGTADSEGNTVGVEADGTPGAGASHPLHDLAWIRNELIEWLYTNLMFKWDTIQRKGRSKLSLMFSGYGQTEAVTRTVFDEVERFLEEAEHRERALDRLEQWDAGDLHRLISAFLGVRFPMALALNKYDLTSAKRNVEDILNALPIHGAHIGIPLSAHREMLFVKQGIERALGAAVVTSNLGAEVPTGVWKCLQAAVSLREPLLIFPVVDFTSYSPLPGLNRLATEESSLPSVGMIACLEAAGGSRPTLWDPNLRVYTSSASKKGGVALRDVLVLKQGSTVEDAFFALKNLGALGGEFVRAEAADKIGAASRLVPKNQILSKQSRILKIMTSKRANWQAK